VGTGDSGSKCRFSLREADLSTHCAHPAGEREIAGDAASLDEIGLSANRGSVPAVSTPDVCHMLGRLNVLRRKATLAAWRPLRRDQTLAFPDAQGLSADSDCFSSLAYCVEAWRRLRESALRHVTDLSFASRPRRRGSSSGL